MKISNRLINKGNIENLSCSESYQEIFVIGRGRELDYHFRKKKGKKKNKFEKEKDFISSKQFKSKQFDLIGVVFGQFTRFQAQFVKKTKIVKNLN